MSTHFNKAVKSLRTVFPEAFGCRFEAGSKR